MVVPRQQLETVCVSSFWLPSFDMAMFRSLDKLYDEAHCFVRRHSVAAKLILVNVMSKADQLYISAQWPDTQYLIS